MIDATKYPQLAKMQEVKAAAQAVGDFLDWLSENGMHVGQYVIPEGYVWEKAVPINEGPEALMSRYFGIDQAAVENERRAVLAEHNASSSGNDGVTPNSQEPK